MGSPRPSRILGAFGLASNLTQRDLYDEFARFGRIEKCELIMDRRTGRSRGFGCIYFEDVEDARRAREELNGTRLGGANIRVDYSLTRRAHTPTPGQYMGRPSQRLDNRDDRDDHRDDRRDDGRRDDRSSRSRDYDRRSPPRRGYSDYDR